MRTCCRRWQTQEQMMVGPIETCPGSEQAHAGHQQLVDGARSNGKQQVQVQVQHEPLLMSSLRACCRLCKRRTVPLWMLVLLVLVLVVLQQWQQQECVQSAGGEPIDVVYTWVNGSDERFQQTLLRYAAGRSDNESTAAHRFSDKDELRYSLRSLEKHMGWVRRVYVVTNGQIPHWLNLDNPRVRIVTHDEIFPEKDHLPTFSSPAIEANLHRIPHLSERFIYFNDDVFLNSAVYPSDFFTPAEGFRVHVAWLLPNCAANCHWHMLENGQCDRACYHSACDFDLTDCDHLTAELLRQLRDPAARRPSPLRLFSASFQDITPDGELLARVQEFNAQRMRIFKQLKHAQLQHAIADEVRRRMRSRKVLETEEDEEDDEDMLRGRGARNRDLFTAALLRSQLLLGARFGSYAARRVIAHAPILIERRIMQRLQDDFPAAFRRTQRHRFRHASNVQIEFLYSHYVQLAFADMTPDEVFDQFDTDGSGTWADREIRTLLARMHPLPLTYEMLAQFESMLMNCTGTGQGNEPEIGEQPDGERYVNSPLPTIPKEAVRGCRPLQRRLAEVGRRKVYRSTEVNAAEIASFNMLRTNVTAAALMLDQIRKYPRKFVCLNDDLAHANATRDDNDLIATLLADFFRALFPQPSKFELPPTVRNRYTHVEDLHAWQLGWRSFATFLQGFLIWVALVSIGCTCCWLVVKRRSLGVYPRSAR